MTANLRILGCCLLFGTLVMFQEAQGQVVQASYSSPVLDRTTPAMRYFGRGRQAAQARTQTHRQAPLAQRYHHTGGKPFQHVSNRPTLSPYLSLDMVQTNEGIPNYYSRVLPQIQQQEAEQKQAAELRRLQQQLRLASAPGMISNKGIGTVPTTGGTSQFMNKGGYFPSLKR